MAKLKLTRPELKRQRDSLTRFERYLPTLKLKQQQLQMTMREVVIERQKVHDAADAIRRRLNEYKNVLRDIAGIDIRSLAKPSEVKTSEVNIAGVRVPVFEGVEFPQAAYSLFATPAWVDAALADLRELNKRLAEAEVIDHKYDLLKKELTKIIQRVNLFEKVKIPQARETIRVIRIHLGDEMTAGVARAKIAKAKLSETGAIEGHVTYAGSGELEAKQP